MDSTTFSNGHPLVTLRIGNLPAGTGDDALRVLLAPFGVPQRVRGEAAETGNEGRGVRYVDMASEGADLAITGLHGKPFKGVVIDVSAAGVVDQVERQAGNPGPQSPDDELPSILTRHHYEVASVEPADLPDDGKGQDWYRYVLSSGRSCITGFHRGSLEEVTEYATGCAAAFNLRNLTGKSARVAAVTQKK